MLVGSVDREPELDHLDAIVDEHAFDVVYLHHELLVLFGSAEAHDGLDDGTVVPAAVKEDDFARIGEAEEIALKKPLAGLVFGGLGQCDYAHCTRIEVSGEVADGAALARCIAPFEDDE